MALEAQASPETQTQTIPARSNNRTSNTSLEVAVTPSPTTTTSAEISLLEVTCKGRLLRNDKTRASALLKGQTSLLGLRTRHCLCRVTVATAATIGVCKGETTVVEAVSTLESQGLLLDQPPNAVPRTIGLETQTSTIVQALPGTKIRQTRRRTRTPVAKATYKISKCVRKS